jgi:hypothetical protein
MNFGTFHHVLLHPYRRRANRRRELERLAKAGQATADAARALGEALTVTSEEIRKAARRRRRVHSERNRKNHNRRRS